MVAKINILKRLLDALNYNEKKVEKGKAECLYAGNYLREVGEMNFYQKLERLKNLDELNTRATTKTLHVSLNFDPSEKISAETLCQIATLYMEKIGFGDQPYLVYKHEDAGHPHIHIVSTAIKADGTRINTHNIGKVQSEKARKEIEEVFKLVKASSKNHGQSSTIQALDLQKVVYGKSDTKQSISKIVNGVFNDYLFTSLPEFNAALQQFNVIADRGTEESRIYKTRGLMYRIIDETGTRIGIPIKASLISTKPTLGNLEKRFESNRIKKEEKKAALRGVIDECLKKRPVSVQQLISMLQEKQVYTMLRQNTDGRAYGITFVDNTSKCVFNGSEIGKSYSISGLQQQLSGTRNQEKILPNVNTLTISTEVQSKATTWTTLEDLIHPMQQTKTIPSDLRKKKKKKRKNE